MGEKKFQKLNNLLSERCDDDFKKKNIPTTKIHLFAEKMSLIIDDPVFIVEMIKGLNEDLINRIVVSERKSEKVTHEDYKMCKKKIAEYEENVIIDTESESDDSKEADGQVVLEINGLEEDKFTEVSVEEKEEEVKDDNTMQKEETGHDDDKKISIYIRGEVNNPGLYHFNNVVFLSDIIKKAGGITAEADEDKIMYMEEINENKDIIIPKKRKKRFELTGAVKKPAVYYIEEGKILADYINAAGGFSDDADTMAVPLITEIKENDRIVIPRLKTECTESGKENNKKPILDYQYKSKENTDIKEENVVDDSGCDILLRDGEKSIILHAKESVKEETIRHNKLLEIFNWIKSVIRHKFNSLPGSTKHQLESVEDQIKLHLLIQGHEKGLSKKSLDRLLKIQDRITAEKLKELIEFYIKIEG